MTRADRRTTRWVRWALPMLVALGVLGGDAKAAAEWNPTGALAGSLWIDVEGEGPRLGGVFTAELRHSFGTFELGFVTGLGALTRGNDEDNRFVAPFGASLALAFGGERIGGHVVARGGVWTGADFDGLRGGAFGSAGATLDFWFRGGLGLAIGADVWIFTSGPTRFLVAPTVALRFQPRE